MEKTFQQRLVGAIVLVALGVILVPALLDGSGYKSRHNRSVDIPVKPLLPTLKEVKIKPVVIATPLDIRKERVAQKKIDNPPKPIESWALQVGTFSKQENALTFRDDLKKQGYLAYSEMTESKGKKSYRVRIGPELEKAKLEKLKVKLKAEKKIDGYILKHP
ncbi:MAG: SPOR domain-containing protein [Gammaproteobacteria bacterium]|nr:SPOR domain-containing protein [Gammaproteobacteria bacterium]